MTSYASRPRKTFNEIRAEVAEPMHDALLSALDAAVIAAEVNLKVVLDLASAPYEGWMTGQQYERKVQRLNHLTETLARFLDALSKEDFVDPEVFDRVSERFHLVDHLSGPGA